jgi:hypothetical protein
MVTERCIGPGGDGPAEGGDDIGPAWRHPLADGTGLIGRVVTVLDPDGYVMVDGLLVRAVLAAGRPDVGDDVALTLDPGGTRLTARATGVAEG